MASSNPKIRFAQADLTIGPAGDLNEIEKELRPISDQEVAEELNRILGGAHESKDDKRPSRSSS
jgi:hypothetical protein